MSWRHYEYFPVSRPREAKGGIRSKSKRGTLGGESWWAQRWIDVLESFDIGARLQRGRTYARKGQVLSIDIDKGVVNAKVQGSRVKPYAVTIRVDPLGEADWKKLAEVLSSQAIFAAKLLAGEMPANIEEAFQEAGLSVFPRKKKDLDTDCSCPDWSNPCKHIAAVYYLIGEEFDRDPFLIFKLRGVSREELVELLHGAGAEADVEPPPEPEPLPAEAVQFWSGGVIPEGVLGEIRLPPISAALPKRLGPLPFWRGDQPLATAVESVYAAASQGAMELFLRESG